RLVGCPRHHQDGHSYRCHLGGCERQTAGGHGHDRVDPRLNGDAQGAAAGDRCHGGEHPPGGTDHADARHVDSASEPGCVEVCEFVDQRGDVAYAILDARADHHRINAPAAAWRWERIQAREHGAPDELIDVVDECVVLGVPCVLR